MSMTVPLDPERLRATVARAVRKVCPRWLADEADDIVQVATVRLFDRMQASDGAVEFSAAYAYRTAYSAVIDEIRRRRRSRVVPMESDVPTSSPTDDPERQAMRQELRRAIHACVAALALARRRAVTLHLLEHSLAEIGELLECGRKKADNLVYRGLRDLRACLRRRGVAL
jgi:RNA polymerase sigma-70 factor (ECF subfamily)